jgi:PKD repeat protein
LCANPPWNKARCPLRIKKPSSLVLAFLMTTSGLLFTACGGGGGGSAPAISGDDSSNDVIINEIATSTRQNKLKISWEYDTNTVPELKGFRVYDSANTKVCETETFDAALQHQMTCNNIPFDEINPMTFTMTAYDSIGTESAKSALMTANKSPIAKIAATGKNRSVQFSASQSSDLDGTIAGYFWSFSDNGATASTQNVDHDFTIAGLCTITLTVTDNQSAQTSVQASLNIP